MARRQNILTVIDLEEAELLRLNHRALEESPDLIAIIGTDYRFYYVNPVYAGIHRRKQKDFTGAHARTILGDTIVDTVLIPNVERCLNGEHVQYEGRFNYGNQQPRHMEVEYFPLRDAGKAVEYVVIITRDVTRSKEAQTFLERSMEFLFNVLNTLDDPVLVKDSRFRWVIVNDVLCNLVGRSKGELIGRTDYDIYPKEQADDFREKDIKVLDTGKAMDTDERVTWKNKVYAISTKRSLFADTSAKKYIVSTMRDITRRKQMEEKLAYMATHDSLTKLPNRALFGEHLNLALSHAQRNKVQVGVMLLDLDKFKQVNDTLGHKAGDQLLIQASSRIRNLLRKSDTVARLGGDEFMVLLPNLRHDDEVDQVAQKILAEIEFPFVLGGSEVRISTSIGIAIYPDDGMTGPVLVKRADAAMYAAKSANRNTWRRYVHGMQMNVRD